jgi:HD-like signal output (HDOD) protein
MVDAALTAFGRSPAGAFAAAVVADLAPIPVSPVERIEHLYPISPALRRLVVLSQGLDDRDLRRLVRNSPSVMAKVVGECRRIGLANVALEQLLSLKSVPQEVMREALGGALNFHSRYQPLSNERMHQNAWMRAMLRARCVRELVRLANRPVIDPNVGALIAMCADIGSQVANVLDPNRVRLPPAGSPPAPGIMTAAGSHDLRAAEPPHHGDLGGQLLAAWDVDRVVVDAVACQDYPEHAPASSQPYAVAVRMSKSIIWHIPGIYEEQDLQEDYQEIAAGDWAVLALPETIAGELAARMTDFAIWLRTQSVDVLPLARRRSDTPALAGPGTGTRPAEPPPPARERTAFKTGTLALLAVPSLTPYCSALLDLARLEVMDLRQVAHAIESSPSMTAFLVGRANGIWRRQQGFEILGVQEAMSVVGEKALRTMLFEFANANERYAGATAGQMTGCSTYWMHATAMAFAAREISRRLPASLGICARELELLAYVHGIGQSAAAFLDPDAFIAAMARAPNGPAALEPTVDDREGGPTPIDALGALLCRKWGLPEDVCAAIAGFRQPEKMPVSRAQTLAYCLLVAKALVIDAALAYPEPLALRPVRRFTDRELAALGLERGALVEIRAAIAQFGEPLLTQYAGLRD